MLKMASMAAPPNTRSSSRIPTTALNHTALTGVSVRWFTRFRGLLSEPKQSSRAYAKATRDAATTEGKKSSELASSLCFLSSPTQKIVWTLGAEDLR